MTTNHWLNIRTFVQHHILPYHFHLFFQPVLEKCLMRVHSTLWCASTVPWPSYRIRIIADCACAGNVGTFSPPPQVSDLDMHHGTCVTHVPWCMPGSLTSGLHWSEWRGKCSRHSRRMRNPQFYASGQRPMAVWHHNGQLSYWCPPAHVPTTSYNLAMMEIAQAGILDMLVSWIWFHCRRGGAWKYLPRNIFFCLQFF